MALLLILDKGVQWTTGGLWLSPWRLQRAFELPHSISPMQVSHVPFMLLCLLSFILERYSCSCAMRPSFSDVSCATHSQICRLWVKMNAVIAVKCRPSAQMLFRCRFSSRGGFLASQMMVRCEGLAV
eukprot:scaffold46594_cov15-Tisochrysis_lutea.AAC.1